ncbi:MAG: hypothetical protein ACTHU0_00165 [Kofleriaceae bacterium]
MPSDTDQLKSPALADLTDEAVAYASKWWADHVRRKTPKNNGEPLHSVLDTVLNADVSVPEEQILRFEAALAEVITADYDSSQPDRKREPLHKGGRLARIGQFNGRMSVDYGPDATLRLAIAKCGENANGSSSNPESKIARLLPWKTDLNINMVRVRDRLGYRAADQAGWRAYDEQPLVGPGARLRVVDRWVSVSGRERGSWMNGGTTEGQIAFVTLDNEAIEPTPIALVLRGYVDFETFHQTLEDGLEYALRDDLGGYLAIVVPR